MCHIIFNITSKLSCSILGKRFIKNLLHVDNLNTQEFYKMDLKCNLSTFQGVEDRFHGITIDSKVETCSNEEFANKLDESLKCWIENQKRGIWFKVAIEHTDWVPILAKKGFNFHHANPGYVMMYHWLPSESCNIPSYAHTMLAVGAIVVNEKSEILVVREKYFLSKHWKFPGGLVEPGEDLINAVVREVKEETNIDGEFDSVIALRHAHKGMFDCSDLYVVISLKALNEEINKCPREILECKWMDAQAFLDSEEATELNKLFLQRYLEYKDNNINIECKEGIHQILQKHYCVYSAVNGTTNGTL